MISDLTFSHISFHVIHLTFYKVKFLPDDIIRLPLIKVLSVVGPVRSSWGLNEFWLKEIFGGRIDVSYSFFISGSVEPVLTRSWWYEDSFELHTIVITDTLGKIWLSPNLLRSNWFQNIYIPEHLRLTMISSWRPFPPILESSSSRNEPFSDLNISRHSLLDLAGDRIDAWFLNCTWESTGLNCNFLVVFCKAKPVNNDVLAHLPSNIIAYRLDFRNNRKFILVFTVSGISINRVEFFG